MQSLFRVDTVSGGSFYVVAESYAGAHDLFRKMVETNEREVHSYYKLTISKTKYQLSFLKNMENTKPGKNYGKKYSKSIFNCSKM